MEENTKSTEIAEEYKPKYTKQQNILYTIISIGLFCLIYFGGKEILQYVNRSYYCFQHPETVNAETLESIYEVSGISYNYGLVFENSRLYKDETGYSVEILFSGVDNIEKFEENGILFEYGDVEEDIRINFYPYSDNPLFEEYAFAERYVNIEDGAAPNSEIYVFEYEDEIFVKYQEYGYNISSEIKSLFSDCEKVY